MISVYSGIHTKYSRNSDETQRNCTENASFNPVSYFESFSIQRFITNGIVICITIYMWNILIVCHFRIRVRVYSIYRWMSYIMCEQLCSIHLLSNHIFLPLNQNCTPHRRIRGKMCVRRVSTGECMRTEKCNRSHTFTTKCDNKTEHIAKAIHLSVRIQWRFIFTLRLLPAPVF